MFKAFTTSARKLVSIAGEEATSLGHSDIGPEHLLLAAAYCGGPAETLLARLGIDEADVRARIVARRPMNGSTEVSLSADAVWTLAAAVRRADGQDARRVGSAHILHALTRAEAVRTILAECEVAPESVCDAVDSYGRLASDAAHIAPPLDDARALLAIIARGGEVSAWLSHHGVDEDAVRDAFRALALALVPTANGE
ncbi:MAG: Clp amino terminal domain, pathogenicity island component [Solirubrobacteraceae bacterium]|jgi:ATP-dependent Clp protease ATP-binding subunit ClpA|nr:Clp amino terminal domain, pathogenicity island component [Solirubrobacteraceae bacterium]